MKILLDECVTKKVKTALTDYEVFTVFDMGFSGLKNGQLLRKAQENHFDIILTIDKNMDHQQNIKKFNISIVVLETLNSNFNTIKESLPEFIERMKTFKKGHTYRINH